jgi:3-oxoacyl-[acyl-carrier protein] reductase
VAAVVADVTRADDAERAVQETVARLGRFDVLINNAGINPRFEGLGNEPAFSRITIEAWTATVAVNVNGPFFMARAAVPRLIAQGWGRIIGVTTSFDTMTRTAPYGPSKAAHEALVAVMARELEGSGVTANVLIPGAAVRTNMTLDRIQGELLDPQIMQAPVVWLASPSSDGVNGRRIVAENWDQRLPLPERVARASAPVAWPQLGRQRTAG